MTETELEQLTAGDRLTYFGVAWRVRSCNDYRDRQGYGLQEWLLESQLGKQYYLLRESNVVTEGEADLAASSPVDQASDVKWLIAEELNQPKLKATEYPGDLLLALPELMRQQGGTPIAVIEALNRTYYFESATEGTYNSDQGPRFRTTWDYWDSTHLWNLALECWESGVLVVYSTKQVQPAEFTRSVTAEAPIGAAIAPVSQSWQRSQSATTAPGLDRKTQYHLALWMTGVGFVLMLMGV